MLVTALFVLAPLVASGPSAGAPHRADEASALLDAARAALGDETRLAEVRSVAVTGAVRVEASSAEGRVEIVAATDGRARRRLDIDGLGRLDVTTDGTSVWEAGPLGRRTLPDAEARRWQRAMAFRRHAPWRELWTGGLRIGSEPVAGRRCHVLELVPLAAEAPAVRDVLWLDEATHRPAAVVFHARPDRSAPLRLELADWRGVDGVMHPHRVRAITGDMVLAIDVTRIEHDVALEDGAFVAPEPSPSRPEEAPGDGAITLERLDERPLASIRVTCEHADLQRNLSVILAEAMEGVVAAGLTPAGPPLVRYHAWGEVADIEGGIPLSEPIEPRGRLQDETLPGGPALVAWHVGPYDRLGETHTRIMAFMEAEGWHPRGACWEEYWTDPGLEPDPSRWRTRVVWPVEPCEPGREEDG